MTNLLYSVTSAIQLFLFFEPVYNMIGPPENGQGKTFRELFGSILFSTVVSNVQVNARNKKSLQPTSESSFHLKHYIKNIRISFIIQTHKPTLTRFLSDFNGRLLVNAAGKTNATPSVFPLRLLYYPINQSYIS